MEAEFKGLEVGQILACSWGYEQTNVDFYVVKKAAVVGQFTQLAKIAGEIVPGEGCSPMAGYTKAAQPVVELAGREVLRKKVKAGGAVKLTSYSHAYPWDGRAKYVSWYG